MVCWQVHVVIMLNLIVITMTMNDVVKYLNILLTWQNMLVLSKKFNMKKYRVLQLGLQLGFLVVMDIYNSWYLYGPECYRTSCNNYNEHPMSYVILYIWCNSHATIRNFFATNLRIRLPHTFQHGKRNANVAFHPFVNKWHMLIPFATYLQLFYN